MLRSVRRPFGRAPDPLTLLIAGLMALALVLYVGGVTVERSAGASHSAACVQNTEQSGQSSEAGGEGTGAETHSATPCAASSSSESHGVTESTGATATSEAQNERVLGVAVEDPGVVTLIALGWLLLIAGVLFIGRRVLPLVLAAAAIALLFDVAEVVRQVGEQRAGVAALAVFVALGHGAVAALAVVTLAGRAGPLAERLRPGRRSAS